MYFNDMRADDKFIPLIKLVFRLPYNLIYLRKKFESFRGFAVENCSQGDLLLTENMLSEIIKTIERDCPEWRISIYNTSLGSICHISSECVQCFGGSLIYRNDGSLPGTYEDESSVHD